MADDIKKMVETELTPEMLEIISGGQMSDAERATTINAIIALRNKGVKREDIIRLFCGVYTWQPEENQNTEDISEFQRLMDEYWPN